MTYHSAGYVKDAPLGLMALGSRRWYRKYVLIAWVAICTVCSIVDASAWDPSDDLDDWYGREEATEPLNGPEIRDPFFEFVVRIVEEDSLGTWSREDLLAYVSASGRETKLPVDQVVALSRLSCDEPGHRVVRLELADDLELPLPYSILGYHPGTLYVSRVLEATESNPHDAVLHLPGGGDRSRKFWVSEVRVLTFVVGHVVLDVDGLIDRLLGKKLDDAWLECFVLARVVNAPAPEDNGLNGLALGRSRKDRPLSGSFDFRRDKVLPNGRPVAKALSYHCRRHNIFPESRAWSWQP